MKKNYFLSFLLLAALSSKAQLVNNGGTITLQQGAYLVCTGNLTNTSGTITNDGRIEVQGNFTNAGTYNSTANEDSLIMSGSGNALLAPGSAILNFLTINKATNTDVVTLGGTTIVNNRLDYLSGALSTDYAANPSYVLSAPRTAVFNFAAGREIAGSVKRTGWANGTPVTFNSAQMQITTNGGSAVPTDITVTMVPLGDPSQAEREVKRKFLFAQNGGVGFTADVRFPYATTELNGNNVEANLVPWNLIGSEWTARLTPITKDAVNKFVATTGIDAASFTGEWKLADPHYAFAVTAYIKGAWNNPTGLMRTTLNTSGLLPLTQPYNTVPFNYPGTESVSSIPNTNIVDWVLVELRKPSTGLAADAQPSTFIGRKAGFLLNNGTVVDLDGVTPLAFDIAKQGSGNFIVVRHRNHLAVMSKAIASPAVGSFANDFSVYANNYEKPGATSQAASLLFPTGAGSTKYGLWPGDVNRSGSVTISDITPINSAIAGPASGNTNVYNIRDINLDRNVTIADASITNSSMSALAATSSSRTSGSSKGEKQSHVPGEVIK
jgi:hypothetical protein